MDYEKNIKPKLIELIQSKDLTKALYLLRKSNNDLQKIVKKYSSNLQQNDLLNFKNNIIVYENIMIKKGFDL